MSDTNGATPAAVVLVADGDEFAAQALTSILEAHRFTVVRAKNGAEATALALAQDPDAVIVGHGVPPLGGIELCRRLSAEPRFSQWTPIVLLTLTPIGRAQRVEAHRAGAWDVLSRPVDGEVLLLKLRAFLGARRGREVLHAGQLLDVLSGLYSIGNVLRRVDEIRADASLP